MNKPFQDSAGANTAVTVRGLKELNRAFGLADRELAKQLRSNLREIARPIADDAQRLAETEIRNMPLGKSIDGQPAWSRMRIGYGYGIIYVAPQERGRRSRRIVSIRRPNLATLLMDRAMDPALERNRGRIQGEVDKFLERVEQIWGNA